jgi:RNA polymerase sigma factor (sigma-70 family)
MQLSIAAQLQAEGLDGESDEALATRGDAKSFVKLYRRHLRPVYSYLYARVAHVQEAEDLTSLAFERALGAFKSYRPTGSFRGWLFTIAHRTLMDHYRARKPPAMRVEGLAATLIDPAVGPEEVALVADDIKQVLAIVGGLSQEQQEVIALRFMAELPYAEIARTVNKREAAVKMIAYRALEEIRQRYSDGNR